MLEEKAKTNSGSEAIWTCWDTRKKNKVPHLDSMGVEGHVASLSEL